MTSIDSIRQMLGGELWQVNALIADTLTSPNELMNRVVRTYLEKKGKQIRPIMVLLSARLMGEVNADVMRGAVAVELLHNASLIHDDVVDDTRERRNAPTINGLWDNHLAVLVGDFFLSNALVLAGETENIHVVKSIAKLGRLLSIGELDEIYSAHYNDLDREAYFKIIFRKTASLFVSCAEVGAYACTPTIEGSDLDKATKLNALCEFARLLGLCFQIKDDIFDYFPRGEIGKPTGNDLREGKITLPLLHALTANKSEKVSEMVQLAHKENLTAGEIETLVAFARDNGGIEYAEATMRDLRDDAVAQLEAAFPASETREAFVALIDHVIARNH